MNGANQKALKKYLLSRHSGLASGILLVVGSALLPVLMSRVSGIGFSEMIEIALKWFGGKMSENVSYSRTEMISILGAQISALILAFGVATLFSYTYSEFKFKETIDFLKNASATSDKKSSNSMQEK
jgi:hypothetical protein